MAEVNGSFRRKCLPPSRSEFDQRVADILTALQTSRENTEASLARLDCGTHELRTAIESMTQQVMQARVDVESLRQSEVRLRALEESAARQDRTLGELLWAEVFNSTVSSSEWLVDKSFSPGRWAVGYPYLYLLYRVLDEIRPVRILDLGLGQSTRMIAQYAASMSGVEHLVVEHDEAWVDFFSRGFRLPHTTSVLRVDWDYTMYKGEEVRIYAGLRDLLKGMEFDLISIDGPFGGDMRAYARIDVLGLLPGCLAPSFVIMIDDFEREGESRTMREMRGALSAADIAHRYASYSGSKDVGLLCSADFGFLRSM